MHEKTPENNSKKGFIPVIIVCAIIAAAIIIACAARDAQNRKAAEKEAEKNRLANLRVEYVSAINQNFTDYFDFDNVDGASSLKDLKITARASSRFTEKSSYGGSYDWEDSVTVTITTDNAFDLRKKDREKYQFLKDAHSESERAVADLVRNEVPDYDESLYNLLSSSREDNCYGKMVFHFQTVVLYLKTPDNTYETLGNVLNYYALNGKDHFVNTPTPKSSPKPTRGPGLHRSSSGSSYSSDDIYDDPYDVYDYDNEEDFYLDNMDDFDDYDDAADYYDEVMGE